MHNSQVAHNHVPQWVGLVCGVDVISAAVPFCRNAKIKDFHTQSIVVEVVELVLKRERAFLPKSMYQCPLAHYWGAGLIGECELMHSLSAA